jgi:hypothetical protein
MRAMLKRFISRPQKSEGSSEHTFRKRFPRAGTLQLKKENQPSVPPASDPASQPHREPFRSGVRMYPNRFI